jgi:hypothetical protein
MCPPQSRKIVCYKTTGNVTSVGFKFKVGFRKGQPVTPKAAPTSQLRTSAANTQNRTSAQVNT